MQITKVRVQNFRLLRDVEIGLERLTTVIVGRNNSGKTSIAELFRRLLTDRASSFRLEDFSLGCHEKFWTSFRSLNDRKDAKAALRELPVITLTIDIAYDVDSGDLGPLSECVIDLNPDCSEVRLAFSFAPRATGLETLFGGVAANSERDELFRKVRGNLSSAYVGITEAIDPNDPLNKKSLEPKILAGLVHGGFINAQRGLDDDTHHDRDVLGSVLQLIFQSALTDASDPQKRSTAEQLKAAVEQIQSDLHLEFNTKLTTLLPSFELFGYPGLPDPELVTETTFDVDRLLNNHTKVRYRGINGVTLPESYNGLGVRNLVFMLLQLHRFFRQYQKSETAAGVHLIFIEEPEAHLHPQMQEVFIRQLHKIKEVFVAQLNDGRAWPVQFVVTTHSPHLANEASFESMRYFLSVADVDGIRRSVVKDLRQGMGGTPQEERDFLHQYLTLSRCDLFFADKAVLVEGTSERLLLPLMIRKTDDAASGQAQLRSQYLTVMEVGGAYAHRFFNLIDFLELRTLVITDIDSVAPKGDKRVAVDVASGSFTSNGCIKDWFERDVSPAELLAKTSDEKVKGGRRLAFQVPEAPGGPCGRSFEDAFILANVALFDLGDGDAAELAYKFAADQKKSSFALRYALETVTWSVPRYIGEGLRWLAESNRAPTVALSAVAAEIDSVVASSGDVARAVSADD